MSPIEVPRWLRCPGWLCRLCRPAQPTLQQRLQLWLDYVNNRTGEPVGRVACYPSPGLVRSPGEVYFYRPGQVLVDSRRLDAVEAVGAVLRPRRFDPTRSTNLATETVQWDPYAPGSPTVPQVLAELDRTAPELRDLITPNHVGFPATAPPSPMVYGAPWVNGGPGGHPRPVPPTQPYRPTILPATNSVPILLLDTGLIDEDHDADGCTLDPPGVVRSWLINVTGSAEPQFRQLGDPASEDLFDCHGKFIAGVLGCTASSSLVRVVDVYDDAGSVDVVELAKQIDTALVTRYPDTRVVVISGGLHTETDMPPLELKSAIEAHPNVLFVTAAGNRDPGSSEVDARRPFYPAALGGAPYGLANVIGVGATDSGGEKASFTNLAPSAQVFAHGQDVMNAFKPGNVYLPGTYTQVIPRNSAGTALWSGTSFAAPVIAGLLAVYLGGEPTGPVDRDKALNWLQNHRPTGAPAVSIP
jgi:Subtilase family